MLRHARPAVVPAVQPVKDGTSVQPCALLSSSIGLELRDACRRLQNAPANPTTCLSFLALRALTCSLGLRTTGQARAWAAYAPVRDLCDAFERAWSLADDAVSDIDTARRITGGAR